MVALEILISLLLFTLFIFGAICGLRFFFVCVSVPFSNKSASQFRGHPIRHVIWSIIGLFSLMLILLAFGIEPPGFYKLVLHFERPHQRHIIFERAQSVGGWDTIQKESEDLLDKHRGDYFHWDKWHTNMPPLTPALAGLKPQTIWVDERSNLPPILRIDIFGMWHTGSDPTPYYGIWVTRDSLPATLNPQVLVENQFGILGANHVHCITNQVYEIY